MRVLLIAAVLGTVAYPTFATTTIDCRKLKIKAELTATAAESLDDRVRTLPGAFDWKNSTSQQRDEVRETREAAKAQWKEVEMYANIYHAFCKD